MTRHARICLFLPLFATPSALAQAWPPETVETQLFQTSDFEVGDRLGEGLAIDGEMAIVGAPGDDDRGPHSGSAYFLRFDPGTNVWVQHQKITASDGAANELFGARVAIHGDTALVAALEDEEFGLHVGSVYVFERQLDDYWSEVQKLGPSDPPSTVNTQTWFPNAIAVYGETILVGRHLPGKVYAFRKNLASGGWVEVQNIDVSGALERVAMYDRWALVSSDRQALTTAIRFLRLDRTSNVWAIDQLLVVPYQADELSIQDGIAAVGDPIRSVEAASGGGVHIHVRDGVSQTWAETQLLLAPDPTQSYVFGRSVSLQGDRLLAAGFSFSLADWWLPREPRVWVFQFVGVSGTWEPMQVLRPAAPLTSEVFSPVVSSASHAMVRGIYGVYDDRIHIYDLRQLQGVREISIDIKPNSELNTINLTSNGVLPVAILSSPTFDATSIDPTTVTLANAPVRLRGNGIAQVSIQDVNQDGLRDVVVHINTEALVLSSSDREAVLLGVTLDGSTVVRGVDTFRIVP